MPKVRPARGRTYQGEMMAFRGEPRGEPTHRMDRAMPVVREHGTNELAGRIKISLDELRMQVLGAQVLLGFQFQSLFQPGFQQAEGPARVAAGIGFLAIASSLAGLIAPPAQHRLVERGDASSRILRLANRCAEVSLGLLALALGSDVYVVVCLQGVSHPLGFALAAAGLAGGMWFGVGLGWSQSKMRVGKTMRTHSEVDLHTKIEQMLTEARVILPGAQAMLGFQLIVTMSRVFSEMPACATFSHFAALGAMILSVVLLITPAAVHRLSFAGREDPSFHRIGSGLITMALVPLAAGIALDCAVAAWRLTMSSGTAMLSGIAIFLLLIGIWYVWPLSLRRKQIRHMPR